MSSERHRIRERASSHAGDAPHRPYVRHSVRIRAILRGMPYDPERHHRRSIRYRGWDYASDGWYFVTINTFGGEPLLSEVVDGEMILTNLGEIVEDEWCKTAQIRGYIHLDTYVVMPNHVHGIVAIIPDGTLPDATAGLRPNGLRPHSLSSIVGQFKSVTTKRINSVRRTPGAPVWQRNYYERIIRNDHEPAHIRRYIFMNPARWNVDPSDP